MLYYNDVDLPLIMYWNSCWHRWRTGSANSKLDSLLIVIAADILEARK